MFYNAFIWKTAWNVNISKFVMFSNRFSGTMPNFQICTYGTSKTYYTKKPSVKFTLILLHYPFYKGKDSYFSHKAYTKVWVSTTFPVNSKIEETTETKSISCTEWLTLTVYNSREQGTCEKQSLNVEHIAKNLIQLSGTSESFTLQAHN